MNIAGKLIRYQQQYDEEKENPVPLVLLPGGLALHPQKHRLIILGGMPGTGKTAYADCQCALDLARQGYTVVIFSYEMTGDALTERLLANAGKVDLKKIEKRELASEEISIIIGENNYFFENIHIISPRSVHDLNKEIENIAAEVREETIQEPKFAFIWDYLQKIGGIFHSKTDDMRVRTSKALNTIQDLNVKYATSISLVIASLNRINYHTTDLNCFKEAGEIESDADMAIIMRIAGDNGEPLEGEQFWVARKKEIVNIKFDVLRLTKKNDGN